MGSQGVKEGPKCPINIFKMCFLRKKGAYVQCGFKEIKVEPANRMEFGRQGWRNRDSFNQISGDTVRRMTI